LEEKVAAPVSKAENTDAGIGTLYPQNLALTSPKSGGRSVGMVRSRNQATEFSFNL
jgi:hypothetical protein